MCNKMKKFEVESDIEQEAVDLVLKYLGIKGSKLRIIGETGFPDRIFWMPGGKPLLIEFKRPGEWPTMKQRHVHKSLKDLGYKVEVHDGALYAFQAVINAVESSTLSKEGRKILAGARRRCAVLRSRLKKDLDHTGSNKNPKKEKGLK